MSYEDGGSYGFTKGGDPRAHWDCSKVAPALLPGAARPRPATPLLCGKGPRGKPSETPLGPLGQLIFEEYFGSKFKGQTMANVLVKWHGCISWMDMCQYLVLNKPDGRIKRDHIKLQPTLGSMGFNAMWSTQCDNPPRPTGNGSYKLSKVWGRFCCCVYHRRFQHQSESDRIKIPLIHWCFTIKSRHTQITSIINVNDM